MFAHVFTIHLALAILLIPAINANSEFSASCSFCELWEDSRLQVKCKTDDNKERETELDLNNCITNNDGQLRADPNVHNYKPSCFACYMDWGNAATMTCKCPKNDNKDVYYDVSISLDSFIGNVNGYISCFDGKYTSVDHTCGDFDRPTKSWATEMWKLLGASLHG